MAALRVVVLVDVDDVVACQNGLARELVAVLVVVVVVAVEVLLAQDLGVRLLEQSP